MLLLIFIGLVVFILTKSSEFTLFIIVVVALIQTIKESIVKKDPDD